MARPKKDDIVSDSLVLKTTDLLFMRDNFISALGGLETGVHELKRAYVTQFNTLLPEGHPGRITVPFFATAPFDKNAPITLVPGTVPGPRADTPGGALAHGTEANMKRKRKPHDPNAPKRALTSYFLFMQHNKPAIKELHPDWTAQQVSDESERRWSNIGDKERSDYEYMYQVDLARYYKQKECYERGEPVPDISPDEAKRLFQEHLKSGVPFKGRKGKKDVSGIAPIPASANTTSIIDATEPASSSEEEAEDEDEEEEEEEQAPPPKSKRQKTGKETTSKPNPAKPAAKGKPVEAPVAEVAKPSEKPKKKAGRKSKTAEEVTVAPEVESPPPPAKSAAKSSKKSTRKRKSTAADE